MSDAELRPVALQGDADALRIEWSDGVAHRLPWAYLRDNCPCATCRERKSAPPPKPEPGALPILSAAEAQPLRASEMKSVGNYAYGIHFSDGHTTGIYALEYLRELGEAVARARRR